MVRKFFSRNRAVILCTTRRVRRISPILSNSHCRHLRMPNNIAATMQMQKTIVGNTIDVITSGDGTK